ncbi:hypothetical protein BGZ76_011757 [Entomortierella beljakovae]|nr:hypothetical protein BGZ76_011757 [Entomortierella beljakovae]
MPDPQPISNRQRRIREQQAEQNRKWSAAKMGENRTPFRAGELSYLSRNPPPDFSKALDFRQPPHILLADPKIHRITLRKQMSGFSDLFGIKDKQSEEEEDNGLEEYAYLHDDHPGLIYIPAGFTPAAQRTLIKSCLKDYSRHPNKSNLDTHYLVPNSGLWDLHENVFYGKLSCDDPSVLVPRKATMDEQANGYGSDDDSDSNHESGGSKSKIQKPTVPSVRTLVPITNETPTVPNNIPKNDPEPSSQVPILPPAQLLRKMRWITLGYQYHWPSKTYHFDQNAPFPKELCTLSKAVVDAVDGVGPYPYSASDFVGEAGVINYYQLKDRLMGHVDRSELNKDAPLVSFSFGHSCIYLLGGPTREQPPTPILLQSGDILVMTGPCRSAFHGVPRIIEDTLPEYLQSNPEDPEWDIYADYLSEARINLNIRQVYPPGEGNSSNP